MPPIEAKISFLDKDQFVSIKNNQNGSYQMGDLHLTLIGDKNGGIAMLSHDLQKEGEIISIKTGETKEKIYEVTTKYCKKETVNLKFTGK